MPCTDTCRKALLERLHTASRRLPSRSWLSIAPPTAFESYPGVRADSRCAVLATPGKCCAQPASTFENLTHGAIHQKALHRTQKSEVQFGVRPDCGLNGPRGQRDKGPRALHALQIRIPLLGKAAARLLLQWNVGSAKDRLDPVRQIMQAVTAVHSMATHHPWERFANAVAVWQGGLALHSVVAVYVSERCLVLSHCLPRCPSFVVEILCCGLAILLGLAAVSSYSSSCLLLSCLLSLPFLFYSNMRLLSNPWRMLRLEP